MFNFVRILVYCAKICFKRSDSAIDLVKTNKRQAQATSDRLKLKRQAKRDNMKKYRVSLEVDKEWVKNFDLTFDAADEQDAEAQAMVEVKMNLGDYITAYADEEGDE